MPDTMGIDGRTGLCSGCTATIAHGPTDGTGRRLCALPWRTGDPIPDWGDWRCACGSPVTVATSSGSTTMRHEITCAATGTLLTTLEQT